MFLQFDIKEIINQFYINLKEPGDGVRDQSIYVLFVLDTIKNICRRRRTSTKIVFTFPVNMSLMPSSVPDKK